MFDPRGVHGLKEEYDLIIVGAGLSGAVVAEQVKQLPPTAREEKVIAGQFSSGSLLPGDREEGAHWGELLRLHRRARHPGFPVWSPHLPHQVSPGEGVGEAFLRLCPLHPQVNFQLHRSPAQEGHILSRAGCWGE